MYACIHAAFPNIIQTAFKAIMFQLEIERNRKDQEWAINKMLITTSKHANPSKATAAPRDPALPRVPRTHEPGAKEGDLPIPSNQWIPSRQSDLPEQLDLFRKDYGSCDIYYLWFPFFPCQRRPK